MPNIHLKDYNTDKNNLKIIDYLTKTLNINYYII